LQRRGKALLIFCLLLLTLYSGCILAREIPFEDAALPESLPQRPLKPYCGVVIEQDKIFMAVHRGEKPTGGYAVEIFSIKEDYPGRITVKVRLIDPDPTDLVIQAFTYPSSTAVISRNYLIFKKPSFRFMASDGHDLSAVGFRRLRE